MALTLEDVRFIAKQLPEVYADTRMLHIDWLTDEVFAEALASIEDVHVQRLTMAARVLYKDYEQLAELPKVVGDGAITPSKSAVTKAIHTSFRRLYAAIRLYKPQKPPKPFIKQLTCPHCGLEVQIEYQLRKPAPAEGNSRS